MRIRITAILLFLTIIFAIGVSAAECPKGFAGTLCILVNADDVEEFGEIDKQLIQDNLEKIPDNRLNQLTPEQANGIEEKLKDKLDSLSPESRKQVLKATTKSENLDITPKEGSSSKIEVVEKDGEVTEIKLAEAEKVSVKQTELTNIQNATISKDDVISAIKAENIETKDSRGNISSRIENAEGITYDPNTRTLSVERAEKISYSINDSKTLNFLHVPNSTFIDTGDMLEVISKGTAAHNLYIISDQGDNSLIVDLAREKRLMIAKKLLPEYFIQKDTILILPQYNLKINASDDNASLRLMKQNSEEVYILGKSLFLSQYYPSEFKETFWTKAVSGVKVNKYEGIYYAELGSPSKLSFSSNDLEKSFGLYRNADIAMFYLAINKPSHQIDVDGFNKQYSGKERGLIDLQNHLILLNGRISYFVYDEYNQQKDMIQSEIMDSDIEIALNKQNTFIDNIKIDNSMHRCEKEEVYTRVYNGVYNIVELCDPYKKEMQRYIGFTSYYPKKISSYTSEKSSLSPISFEDDLLKIERKKSSVNFYSFAYAKEVLKQRLSESEKIFRGCKEYDSVILGDKKTTMIEEELS